MQVYALMYRPYTFPGSGKSLVSLWEDHFDAKAECLKRNGPKSRGHLNMGGYDVECIPVNMKASTTPTAKPTQVSNEMAVLVVARLLAQLGNHDEEDSFGNARRNAIPDAIELLGLQPSDVKGGDTMKLQPTA